MIDSAPQTLIKAKTSKADEFLKTSARRTAGFLGHNLILMRPRSHYVLCVRSQEGEMPTRVGLLLWQCQNFDGVEIL